MFSSIFCGACPPQEGDIIVDVIENLKKIGGCFVVPTDYHIKKLKIFCYL